MSDQPRCLYCDRGDDAVPLLALSYRGHRAHICSQHLPILIHDPAQLIGKMPGAENLAPADHHD